MPCSSSKLSCLSHYIELAEEIKINMYVCMSEGRSIFFFFFLANSSQPHPIQWAVLGGSWVLLFINRGKMTMSPSKTLCKENIGWKIIYYYTELVFMVCSLISNFKCRLIRCIFNNYGPSIPNRSQCLNTLPISQTGFHWHLIRMNTACESSVCELSIFAQGSPSSYPFHLQDQGLLQLASYEQITYT